MKKKAKKIIIALKMSTLLLPVFFTNPAFSQSYSIQLPDSIYLANTPVLWEKHLAQYCEGPAFEASTGFVYFTEQKGGPSCPIWRIHPQTSDTGSIFSNEGQNNGLEFDFQGRLVACQKGRITRFTATGSVDSILAQSPQNGITFDLANDLSIGSNGGIYFTALSDKVYFLNEKRELSPAASGLNSANGIEWIEELNTVYVNEAVEDGKVTALKKQNNGALNSPVTFAKLPIPDGGVVDTHGNRYVASYQEGEIRVFNAKGDSLGFIRMRFPTEAFDVSSGKVANTSNCAFGGPKNTILYITGDGGLYSVQLNIPGRKKIVTSSISNPKKMKINNVVPNKMIPKISFSFYELIGRIFH